MEFSPELEQLFLNCRSKDYIRANIEYLRSYFSIPANLDMLSLALTTKRNISALKIIEQLGLKVLPHTHIDAFTYTSLYWLNRMRIVADDEFASLQNKFTAIKNFETLFEETEKNFIGLQIEKKRQIYSRFKTSRRAVSILDLKMKRVDKISFFFIMDDIVDVGKVVAEFQVLRNSVFGSDFETLETFSGDVQRDAKISKLREIRSKLYSYPLRSFSRFADLDKPTKDRLEGVMRFVNRIKRQNSRYYICSRRPLADVLCFAYLYLNNIDLTRVVHLPSIQNLPFPVSGRGVFFGEHGTVRYELLNHTLENFRQGHDTEDMEAARLL